MKKREKRTGGKGLGEKSKNQNRNRTQNQNQKHKSNNRTRDPCIYLRPSKYADVQVSESIEMYMLSENSKGKNQKIEIETKGNRN